MGTQLYFGDQPVGGAGGESVPGPPGDSAYEVAVKNGFDGTETEWLDSLQGEPGEKGADSIVPGPQGDPFTYDDFTSEQLEELKGEPGEKGADSEVPGPQGDPFTYDDFTPEQLEDLKGPAGDPASISTWGELAQKA